MTPASELDWKSCARRLLWPAGIAVVVGSGGCAMELEPPEEDRTPAAITFAAAPGATLTSVQPVDGGAIVYEPLAPRSASHARDAQLSIDVVVRNDHGSPISVDEVRLSFGGAVALPGVTLEADVRKQCTGEGVFDLVDDRAIEPNQSCRLILTPDQKLPSPAPTQVTIRVFFVGYADPVAVTMPLQAHQNAPAEGSYRFPANAKDLPAGQYWSSRSSGVGSHHRTSPSQLYAYDAGLVRFDAATGAWSNKHPGQSGASNDDYLVWGHPIYAMADGVVLDFENDADDNVPGDKTSPANFFRIQHGDEIGEYYHLQKGSLNPALLVVGATVTEGQFLGRVGNSGSSDFPHLHVQVRKGANGMPLLFHESFLIDRSLLGAPPGLDAPFTAVDDQGLPWEANILWPSPFLRKDEDTDGAISDVAIAAATASRAVTAARSAAGDLELVSWDVGSDGHIVRKLKEVAGPASEIAIARPGIGSEVVTAFRDSGGSLELIAWDVLATGGFDRRDEASAGAVSKVAVTQLPGGGGVVTALRDGSGNLGLIAWEVAGGVITRRGDDTAEAIADVAIATITQPFEGVVTAARNSAGDLVLTTWELTAANDFIRRDDASAGAISALALAPVGVALGKQLMVTAIRESGGDLKLIAWEITAAGQIVRRGDATGGAITDVAIGPDGQRQIVTAVRDGSGDLKLIAWEVSSSGEFVREGEDHGGAASDLALTGAFLNGGKKFALPAVRDSAGELRLISVQTNLTP